MEKDKKGLGKQSEQIQAFRQNERDLRKSEHLNSVRDRGAFEYLEALQGLSSTLEYVRGLKSKTIIDLGAGSSKAIAEISHSPYGTGLQFKATGLSRDPKIEQHLGWEQYTLTSGERMRGFDPESAGGLLSVFGPLSYSKRMDDVLKKMDEILVPGGVIKACMSKKYPSVVRKLYGENADLEAEQRNRSQDEFWHEHGYGLAFRTRRWFAPDGDAAWDRIVLAIKPDRSENDFDQLAEHIMGQDQTTAALMRSRF